MGKLEPLQLSFTRKSGKDGHLFGSVTSSDIAAELATQGFEVDRRKIQLNEPLKSVGLTSGCSCEAASRSDSATEGESSGGRSGRRRVRIDACGNCRQSCRGHEEVKTYQPNKGEPVLKTCRLLPR